MPKPIRIILFWSFVVLFLVLAPSLVLYTFGFRYNFQTGRVEHTGVISLSTIPRGGEVEVNGKPHTSATPTLVKQLRPREHTITIRKDGFHPWEKRVRVIEQETVFVNDIVLWTNANPVLVQDRGDVHLVNPTGTAIAELDAGGAWTEVWVEDLQRNTRSLIARFPGSDTKAIGISWSPNGERLLLSSESTEILVSKRDGSEQLHPTEKIPGIQSAWWNEGTEEDLIVTTMRETRRVHPATGEASTILTDPVTTLFEKDGRLFFTREEIGSTHVVGRSGDKEEVIAILPPGFYQFVESRLPYLLLFEEERGRMMLLDADGHDQPILLQTEATSAFWSPAGATRLLYTNGLETNIFSPQTLQDTLIDRVSRPVTAVAWHPLGTAIVLAHPEGAVAYDLHEPSFVQTKLNDAGDISRVFIDGKGSFLYFLGTINGTYGLYRQTIR